MEAEDKPRETFRPAIFAPDRNLSPREDLGLVEPRYPGMAVRNVSGKGKGWVAMRQIPAGELLVRERALQVANVDGYVELAHRRLAALLVDDNRYRHLCGEPPKNSEEKSWWPDDVSDAQWRTAIAQVKANAFGKKEKTGYKLSLFQHISACNHSCAPNACISLFEDVAVLYALETIYPGQEICICYDSRFLWLPREVRRPLLQTQWGFGCQCATCQKEEGQDAAEASSQWARYFDESGRVKPFDAPPEDTAPAPAPAAAPALPPPTPPQGEDSGDDDSDDDLPELVGEEKPPGSKAAPGGHPTVSEEDPAQHTHEPGEGDEEEEDDIEDAYDLYIDLSEGNERAEPAGLHHWHTHTAREAAIVRQLEDPEEEVDLDLLLEHVQCIHDRCGLHSHFYAWLFTLERVHAKGQADIDQHPEWRDAIRRIRALADPRAREYNTTGTVIAPTK